MVESTENDLACRVYCQPAKRRQTYFQMKLVGTTIKLGIRIFVYVVFTAKTDACLRVDKWHAAPAAKQANRTSGYCFVA